MNKIILKQQQREKSEEKSKEKRKEKPKEKTLVINQSLIYERLFNHFQHHIGKSNRTNIEEIFQVVIGVNSNQVHSYAKYYWLGIIEKIIRKLRKENTCFVIKERGEYFVLQSEDECDYYKKLCERAIDGMNNATIRAEKWVEEESWRNMSSKLERTIKVKEKKLKSPEEKIEDYKAKAKTKIIKLYRGENED